MGCKHQCIAVCHAIDAQYLWFSTWSRLSNKERVSATTSIRSCTLNKLLAHNLAPYLVGTFGLFYCMFRQPSIMRLLYDLRWAGMYFALGIVYHERPEVGTLTHQCTIGSITHSCSTIYLFLCHCWLISIQHHITLYSIAFSIKRILRRSKYDKCRPWFKHPIYPKETLQRERRCTLIDTPICVILISTLIQLRSLKEQADYVLSLPCQSKR